MRLVCPNCEAKYEVPDDAIPDTGRDVQCTNCNHTWFQMRGRSAAAMALTGGMADLVEPAPEPAARVEAGASAEPAPAMTEDQGAVEASAAVEAEPEPVVAAEAVAEAALPQGEAPVADAVAALPVAAMDAPPVEEVAAPLSEEIPETTAGMVAEAVSEAFPAEEAEQSLAEAPEPEAAMDAPGGAAAAAADADTADDEAAVAAADPVPAAAAYAVDDSVLAILREEAEREATARRAEALESQTELGIDAALSRKSGENPVEVEAKPAARRDLLPDVEEINSTLRPSEAALGTDGTPDFVAPPPNAPHGFRSGFLTLMTIAILAATLYIVAPRLVTIVPALAAPLEAYVSAIDSLRLGLDGMMRSATVAINGG